MKKECPKCGTMMVLGTVAGWYCPFCGYEGLDEEDEDTDEEDC